MGAQLDTHNAAEDREGIQHRRNANEFIQEMRARIAPNFIACGVRCVYKRAVLHIYNVLRVHYVFADRVCVAQRDTAYVQRPHSRS